MARKLGKGTVVKHDHNDDSSFTTINQVESVKLPDEYDFNETEVTALEDTTEQMVRGINKARALEVVVYWDTSDTGHTNLRTGAADADGFPWKIITTDATPETWDFEGFILKLGDVTVTSKGALMRTITVRLTTDITIS
jgi:hypothetical protein